MIRSYKNKMTEAVASGVCSKGFPAQIIKQAQRKMSVLHAATDLEDLRVPVGNRLEALSGDREGQYSIRINAQWRICFEWIGDNAENVEIIDYH